MLDALLSLIPGGALTAIAAAVVSALGGAFALYRSGKKAGRNEQKVKEADSYERHLKEISDAANARPSGGVQSDPYNRDRR